MLQNRLKLVLLREVGVFRSSGARQTNALIRGCGAKKSGDDNAAVDRLRGLLGVVV